MARSVCAQMFLNMEAMGLSYNPAENPAIPLFYRGLKSDLRYEGVVGKGGFGTICSASWGALAVAVKNVTFHLVTDANSSRAAVPANILQEASHAIVLGGYSGRLRSRVVPLWAWSFNLLAQPLCNGDTHELLLVMPLLACNLECFMFYAPYRISLHDTLCAIWDITAAVADLHAHHVVHGDLKEINIMMGQSGRWLLGDFGLSTTLGKLASAPPRGFTESYAAPEVLAWNLISPSSDVFALGVLSMQMLHLSIDVLGRFHPEGVPVLNHLLELLTRSQDCEPSCRPSAYQLWQAVDAVKGALDLVCPPPPSTGAK